MLSVKIVNVKLSICMKLDPGILSWTQIFALRVGISGENTTKTILFLNILESDNAYIKCHESTIVQLDKPRLDKLISFAICLINIIKSAAKQL